MALEVEEYHGRSPLDGYPSAVHYRLPAAPYGRAGVLFALDDDPAKDRVLTLRLGHYVHNGSGGNMTGAVTLDFTDGVPDYCKEVGEVKVGGKVAKLYFADVALNVGNIIDLTTSKDYLDFDITGKQWENFQQMDNSMKPDPHSKSAFNLFGVTLKKTEYAFTQKQAQPGTVQKRKKKAIFRRLLQGVTDANGGQALGELHLMLADKLEGSFEILLLRALNQLIRQRFRNGHFRLL